MVRLALRFLTMIARCTTASAIRNFEKKKKKKDKLLTSPRKGHTVKLQVERKTCGPAIVEFEGGESMALLFIGEFKTNE